jgi:hypothetical protein
MSLNLPISAKRPSGKEQNHKKNVLNEIVKYVTASKDQTLNLIRFIKHINKQLDFPVKKIKNTATIKIWYIWLDTVLILC